MRTDKDLLRARKHIEALGSNHKADPYYILVFDEKGECTNHIDLDGIYTRFDAMLYAKELKLNNYTIGNANADWL